MSKHADSALLRRFMQVAKVKYDYELKPRQARALKNALVEAIKEEVEERFPAVAFEDAVGQSLQRVMTPNLRTPLVIAGLGSFKMRTRPQRAFGSFCLTHHGEPKLITKPAARRLAFTSKWEALP